MPTWRKAPTSERILEYLKKERKAALNEIAKACGITPQNARQSLLLLMARGLVARVGHGIYKYVGGEEL